MCYGGKWLTVGLCVLLALLSTCSARYLSSPQEAETEGAVRDSGLGDDEDLPLQRIPDQLLSRLEAGLPFYLPDDVLADSDDSVEAQYRFGSPLKRGYSRSRLEILKRSRLNRLIHRLLAMRGDRYSYHRASPVRFAAGRR